MYGTAVLECMNDSVPNDNFVWCRYTSLVDRYVPLLSLCLADPNEVVRKHTIMLLTKLLGEDYIKWKGLLLYRFLCTLADPVEEVADFGRFSLFVLFTFD